MSKVTKKVETVAKVEAEKPKGSLPFSVSNKDDFFFDESQNVGGSFDISPALKAELKEKGFAYRWLNARAYQQNYGVHQSGWQVYRRDPSSINGSLDFKYGMDPEGYIRRKDMILGVKPVELQEKHRAKLRAAANWFKTDSVQKKTKEEIKRVSGGAIDVTEGYEENN